MAHTTLVVRKRTVYGNERVYPVNDAARQLCALIGTTTLKSENHDRIEQLKALGYAFEVEQDLTI